MTTHLGKIGTVFLLISCFTSCNRQPGKDVDVSEVKLEVKADRFERDFASITETDYDAKVKKLQQKYPGFFSFYAEEVMGFRQGAAPGSTDPLKDGILYYNRNASIRGLLDTINRFYPETDFLNQELTDLYRHIRFYFPHYPLPRPITVVTEFQYGNFTLDTTYLAISLDRYLGKDYVYYDGLGFYEYVRRKMNRTYITRNCAEVLYNLYFGEDRFREDHSLLEAMIEKGKRLYFIEMTMPALPDSMVAGYTAAQEKWCRESELSIWQFLNDRDLLYQKNYMEQKRYLEESPVTPGMPPEAPGMVPVWTGWQIVRQFALKKGRNLSLEELIRTPAMDVFKGASYRPGK